MKLINDRHTGSNQLDFVCDGNLDAASVDARTVSGDGLALVKAVTAKPVVRKGELAGLLRHLRK